jgi:hypothetical protein
VQQLLGLLEDRVEVGRLERLEDDSGGSLVHEPQPGVERDLRRRHREQPVGGGALELLAAAPQQRVEETHAG